ncbi:cbb3-type cytochrome c oxidase subunit III [Paraburkholderia sp. BL6669N2]|uniref:c-type cytochrome n=1 Tax=Paraburkholderia sp. BL6669N2 TaxID=1938807 RepID=UPI000E2803C2|nr:c-type cytochrome [Paraburkholderia sp. BL6669N2]REG50696.1 cbb3-type cytochrome c oxidase subunit III [Paraburkholderia sp. BL6669N2]
MSEERLFSWSNRWFRASVGVTAAVFVFGVAVGFVWLPSVQRDAQFQGLWNAICSAAGVPQRWLGNEAPVAPQVQVSKVEVTPQLLAGATQLSIGRGATLALRCTMCHGERGMSGANSPNLAGQYAIAIYKQLQDFQSGARTNAVMSPMAANLSDPDMRDLAAYYGSLPRPRLAQGLNAAGAPGIVMHGAPLRNIPACATCHGGIDNKAGSPWLDGLPAAYMRAQLQAFASGERHNDISEQMRNIARNMTPDEIAAAASYYANLTR